MTAQTHPTSSLSSGRCFECGDNAEHQHHVVPRSLGGTKTVPLCAACHATIHDTGITTSDLTARVMREKAARGEYTGGPVPYGHRVADDGVRLELDEYEQKVIAAIHEYRAEGLSLRRIADELALDGFRSRTGRRVSKSSVDRISKFSPNTINRIAKSARIIDADHPTSDQT